MCKDCMGVPESKWGQALDLLQRAGVQPEHVHPDSDGRHYRLMIDVVAAVVECLDPNMETVGEDWFRDYFLITGEHMVLTEEGWWPASLNTLEATGEPPMEVFDEVNAPVSGV